MNLFSKAVIKHKKAILIIFVLVASLCALLASTVSVNYKLVDYLPKDAPSTIALRIIEDEFDENMPGARVMIKDVSVMDALDYKERLLNIPGVSAVSWLDDIVGLNTLQSVPVEFLDESVVKGYYKDRTALFSVTIESGKEQASVAAIYDLIGEDNAASGESVTIAETQNMSVSEVFNAMVLLLPIVIIVLIISTSSWIEPLLFLSSIGIAIVLNMGTNIIFGEVSFISKTVSPILQLAVSLDYAIFLLHSFNKHRFNEDAGNAMVLAMRESIPTVTASAATTIIGFAALLFMRFGIGSDLGLNLLKGVILSFITVIVFMPALTLLLYKAIDKTRHRKLMPDFKGSGKLIMKVRIPFLIIALIVVIPAYLAQAKTEFMYGMGSMTATSRVGRDTETIEEVFGKENVLLLLVPKENAGKEEILCEELSLLPHVKSIVSYVTYVGASIPKEFVPKEAYNQFYSENYSRIILYTDIGEEGSSAEETIKSIKSISQKYYSSHYLAGNSATLYDMKNIVAYDTRRVNLAAIIGIFIVLLVTFRSVSLPFILVFCIETAIWINLSVPYFADTNINFIGYLIISTVQLGATVDYAILFTSSYLTNRKTLASKDSMRETISNNLVAVLISAVILASAGFALALTSNNPIIAELGLLLGRGTLLSLAMVTLVLPALLVLFDKPIQKTTMKAK